jgi:biotin operon repressor
MKKKYTMQNKKHRTLGAKAGALAQRLVKATADGTLQQDKGLQKAIDKLPKTKAQAVLSFCQKKSGTTLDAVVTELGITRVAAASLVNDLRRMGQKIKYDSGRYYA